MVEAVEEREEVEITTENYGEFNIKSIALNKEKLGSLIFEKSCPLLIDLQGLFIELDKLGYKDLLSRDEISLIDGLKNAFVKHLITLSNFDIGQANPKQQRDNYEDQIVEFNNSATSRLRTSLIYLRQEASRKSKEGKNVAILERELTKLFNEIKEKKDGIDAEYEELQNRKQKVESAHGEVASTQLASHFDSESGKNNDQAKLWLIASVVFFGLLLSVLIGNIVMLLLGKGPFDGPTESLYQYGIAKLALVLLLWYGMNFATRNYLALSNLCAANRQRRNVAKTLQDFLASNPEADAKSQILNNGTREMFKHLPTGYLKKDGQKESHPMQEIINHILPSERE